MLVDTERQSLMEQLKKQHHDLESAQMKMSVTHYTQRAKNQYLDFVHKTQELEESMKVLERKRFVML